MSTCPDFHVSLWPFIAHVLISKNLSDSFPVISICASVPRRNCICCHVHGAMFFFFFSNNYFTRVNRRLVNSFSYSNRIFWSRENVITKCKNKQIRAKRFRLYIFSKHCDLWNQQYIFELGKVVASKIKCIIKI